MNIIHFLILNNKFIKLKNKYYKLPLFKWNSPASYLNL